MSRRNRYAEALAAIAQGELVVTGSQRLARELALEYADRQSTVAGTWERPPVLPWAEWTRGLWQQLQWQRSDGIAEALLGAGRRRLLWEQVIRATLPDDNLLRAHSLARTAIEVWDLVCAWQISKEELASHASEDGKRFLDWLHAYQNRCAAGGWLDPALLSERLLSQIPNAAPASLPEAVTLVGFDELAPAQQSVLQALGKAGTSVSHASPKATPSQPVVRAIGDAEDEVAAAAHWALECLQADPEATIGIVIPDLAARHDAAQRLLAETLEPVASERYKASEQSVFAVSAGNTLAAHPLVSAALGFLALAKGRPAWTRVSQMLRSPFLGAGVSEAAQRSLLDVRLRSTGGIHWSLEWLIGELERAASKERAWQCPALQTHLNAAVDHQRNWPQLQSLRGWVTTLNGWLGILGWPGERTLSSDEFQAQERWRALLEELGSLDDLLEPVDFPAALRLIRNHANATIYKPESGRAPVLALGVLEAAGLEFDHLWVCGLHDGAWPPAPSPAPFIPHRLQRARLLPRGSAARELTFAKIQLERLVSSAGEVTLSYPLVHNDEDLRPSPLLADFDRGEAIEPLAKGLHRRPLEIFTYRPRLEALADGAGPKHKGRSAIGGARLFELQAQCPFRSFAELRLGAAALEQPTAGLDARQRGQLAHDSLQKIWDKLASRDDLRRLTQPERSELVHSAVTSAARRLRGVADPLRKASLKIECGRLESLLLQLLEVEAGREPFDVVANERRYELELEGLQLKVRPDRVDRLQSGHLVVDYKTGAVKTADWFGSRPRAPQLPLYATCIGLERVSGAAFVQLRAGELKFAGICDEEAGMPAGVRPLSNRQRDSHQVENWQALLASWRANLAQLARGFVAGDARVDPLKHACDYCHLAGLCRIEEKKRNGEVLADV